MNYIGLAQISQLKSSTLATVNNLTQKYKANIQTLLGQTKTLYNQVFTKSKQIILNAYKDTAYKQFNNVFSKYYGNNYNKTSLQNSLIFNINDKLQPKLTYNTSLFNAKIDLDRKKYFFNQNTKEDNNFNKTVDFLAMTTLDSDGIFEWGDKTISDIFMENDSGTFSFHQPYIDIDKVYEEAEADTNSFFIEQIQDDLCSQILKDYGF